MRVALIDAEMGLCLELGTDAVTRKTKRKRSAAGRRQIADELVAMVEFIRRGGRAAALKIAGVAQVTSVASPILRAISVESSIGPPRMAQSILPLMRSAGLSATCKSIRISGGRS